MYWWSLEKLTQNLAQNNYVKSDTILFSLLNILLSLCQSVIYTSLLFSFLIVEYHFKDWLPGQHALIESYNFLAWILSLTNLAIAITAISWCYYRHKKAGGINFWQRFCALNSSIGFHILLYSTVLLFIGISVLYVIVNLKIEIFKSGVFNTESPMDFLSRLFTNPFAEKPVPSTSGHRGLFRSIMSLPATILSLPFLPGKIAAFLEELREFILQFYPIIAFVPTLFLILQYYLVHHWIGRLLGLASQNKK